MQLECCFKSGPVVGYRVLRHEIEIQASKQMLFKNGLGRGRGEKNLLSRVDSFLAAGTAGVSCRG